MNPTPDSNQRLKLFRCERVDEAQCQQYMRLELRMSFVQVPRFSLREVCSKIMRGMTPPNLRKLVCVALSVPSLNTVLLD